MLNSNELGDLSELSWPGSSWKSSHSGWLGGTRQTRHSCTNWYHPFLWVHINSIAPKVGWSAAAIEKHLVCTQPQFFSCLKNGMIQRWISKSMKKGWSEATKQNIAHCHALVGLGQSGVLAKYPDIVKAIKTELQGMWSAGVALNVLVVWTLMIVIIKKQVVTIQPLFFLLPMTVYLYPTPISLLTHISHNHVFVSHTYLFTDSHLSRPCTSISRLPLHWLIPPTIMYLYLTIAPPWLITTPISEMYI